MATRTTTISGRDTAGVDTRDFQRLASALKHVAPVAYRELRGELKKAGEIMANEARSIVSEHSKSIPPTIRVSARGTRVTVQAGGGIRSGRAAATRELAGAAYGTRSSEAHRKRLEGELEGSPIARLFEVGNAGASPGHGTFRHPVFGRDRWVGQPMHPYLHPADLATHEQTLNGLINAMNRTLDLVKAQSRV